VATLETAERARTSRPSSATRPNVAIGSIISREPGKSGTKHPGGGEPLNQDNR
jgi:hypothetical protein